MLALTGFTGCNKNSNTEGSTKEGAAATNVGDAIDEAVDEATKKAGAEHLFDPDDKEFRKRACEFLTADLVGELFGVPANELKQTKVMGCVYSWSQGGQLLEARLMMIRVHKTLELAQTWFRGATATRTKAELDAQMDSVKKRVKKHEALDTDLKQKTAADLTDVAKMGMPDEGISYDDVAGIGDEARLSNSDGVLWVRLGNVTFQVGAFKGPEQPKPQIDPKNLKGIVKAAMEAQKKWTKDTLPQRKAGAQKLAPHVVKAVAAK
jgi:hypothetical protein